MVPGINELSDRVELTGEFPLPLAVPPFTLVQPVRSEAVPQQNLIVAPLFLGFTVPEITAEFCVMFAAAWVTGIGGTADVLNR